MQSKITQININTIKPSFLNALRNDREVKVKLATGNKCSVGTIERWLRNADTILTTATNISIIKNHFGLLEGTEILQIETQNN